MPQITLTGTRKNGLKPVEGAEFRRPVVIVVPNLDEKDQPFPERHGPRRARVESIRIDLANECDGETTASVAVRCEDVRCGYGYTRPYIVRVMHPDEITGPASTEGDAPGSACPHCGEPAKLRRCCVCGTEAWIIDCGHYPQPRPIAAGRADGSDLGRDYCEYCAYHLAD